jgi:hypothetical protein
MRLSRLIPWLALCAPLAAAPVDLEWQAPPAGDALRAADGGAFEINAPATLRARPAVPLPTGEWILECEWFAAGGLASWTFQGSKAGQAGPLVALAPPGRSETWTPHAARLGGPGGWDALAFTITPPPGQPAQIRNARLRPLVPGEFAPAAGPDPQARARALEAHLAGNPPGAITRVSVGPQEIQISGRHPPPAAGLALAEVPMEFAFDDPQRFEASARPGLRADGTFEMVLPRFRERAGRRHDRLLSRWQLVRLDAAGNAAAPVSHARYADDITPRQDHPPRQIARSKKGLGGWSPGRIPGAPAELDELGIDAVTVNVMIHSLVALAPAADTTPFEWQGRTFHARNGPLQRFDATFREAAKRGAVVSAILLVANPARGGDAVVKRLGYPGASREGTFAMPDVASADGLALYGAILNLMAERWSRADGEFGRVHHWIMHNEVDAGWVWTNAGELPDTLYMDLHHRSMRLMDLIARQYDPHARPFLSLTHHWAEGGDPRWFGSKRITELLLAFCRAEGDFPWGMAYHPYPQNLFNPRTWEDTQATFDFNSKKITPKNIEVLDALMHLPSLRYRGEVRPVHLSENGFNSKDYSEKQLADQAAGMAFAWKKITPLSSVESWHYHNWIDNRGEGGLRIGLRKFPDEPGDPFGKKPIWHLYQALGGATEDEACAPYLPVVGLPDWDAARHRGPIR